MLGGECDPGEAEAWGACLLVSKMLPETLALRRCSPKPSFTSSNTPGSEELLRGIWIIHSLPLLQACALLLK